jgi:predicted PurR-regulated permease PerM
MAQQRPELSRSDMLLPEARAPVGDPPLIVVNVNKYPPGEVVRAALVLLGLALAVYLLWRVQEVLFLLLVAILLATAIEPAVNRLRRGPFSRGTGVLVVYTAIVLAITIPAYLVIPNLVAQGGGFMDSLPDRLLALRVYALHLQPALFQQAAVGAIDQVEASLRTPSAPDQAELVAVGATAAHTLISFLTIFVLAFYWLVERASIKRALLRAVPARRARNVNTVWLEVEEKLGGWVRGQLILMLAVGAIAALGYAVIGLPNPILLGVAAGLFEIVPMVGPFLAFAPAVLVALTIDPARALVVVVYALVIQQLESTILVPRVMGRTVGVSPLTVLLGILVGSALAGLPGAAVAVPLAAAVQVILAHVLRSEDPSQAEEHPTPEERIAQQTGGKHHEVVVA